MKRIDKIPMPKSLEGREKEIMGEIEYRGKQAYIRDCVYNNMIAGEIDETIPFVKNVEEFLPKILKTYQLDDLSKALAQQHVFNKNKPGYGKTLETIIWIKHIIAPNGKFNALIVCPKSVIGTWHAQLNKYWPGWEMAGTWWITNYEQFRNEERFKLVQEFDWDVIVLDESHKIKSMKSKVTRNMFKLQLKAKHRICLTGTPIKNRPWDLAAQLKWLDPYSITTFTDFQSLFSRTIKDKWGEKPVGLTKDPVLVENLHRLLALYCIGGEEHDIGLIAEPQIIKIKLKMDPKVKKLYKMIEGEYNKELECKFIDTQALLDAGIKVSNSIESSIRKQQLASNPQLFDESFKNIKFDWIDDWLDGTDEKVIIVSHFDNTIVQLEKFLRSQKYSVSTVRQKMSAQQRQMTINNWAKNTQVLLGTSGVLGTGVDGLQDISNYMICVDQEWNASDHDQLIKRIIRTGQKKQPFIYILQCVGTIDVRIAMVQKVKGADSMTALEISKYIDRPIEEEFDEDLE